MGFKIEDGTGNGYQAKVSSDNRLDSSSRQNPRIYYQSRDNGDAYSWTSIAASATAGEFIHYIKNTSATKTLVIDNVLLSSSQAGLFKLHVVTGTATGTTMTAQNLNLQSGNTAADAAFGTVAVSGLTSSAVIESARCPANNTVELGTKDSLQLGLGDAIAVEYDAGSTGAQEITVIGYYE